MLKSDRSNGRYRHQQQTAAPEEENLRFATPPYSYENENENTRTITSTITRKHSKFNSGEDLVIVPVEIEIDSMLYNLIQEDILKQIAATSDISFEERVNKCFKERMQQIITDPKEWGKAVLNAIRQAHCLPEVEIQE